MEQVNEVKFVAGAWTRVGADTARGRFSGEPGGEGVAGKVRGQGMTASGIAVDIE